MAECIKANGSIITWKAWVSTPGKTEEDMKDSTETTRNMGTASIHGKTEESTKACGAEENSTALAYISYPDKRRNSACGKTGSESSGSIRQQSKLSSTNR
jgi:hypothetical protein